MQGSCSLTEYACGVCAVTTSDAGAASFGRFVAETARQRDAGFAYLFFSLQNFDPQILVDTIAEQAPDLAYAGCSTSGEITPDGIGEGQALAILLPRDNFAVVSTTLEDISSSGMNRIAGEVARLKCELEEETRGRTGFERFAMCLIDGMSFAEEMVTAALNWALDDIPLIGGSSGDDLKFDHTVLVANGRISSGSAIIMLVATDIPFTIFKTDNFIPTDAKFVVTASDPDRRMVTELNAGPAAEEYANAIGKEIGSLSQTGFASHPVVVRVGGEYFCRAVRAVSDRNGLIFHCAIDDGVVLTLAEARGMVESTRTKFEDIETRLGKIDLVLGFDCVYRRIDAENRQVIRKMSDLYRRHHVLGFGTYGEQYLSMHLNQTLTGIAFGQRQPPALAAAAE